MDNLKRCPQCGEQIQAAALLCRYCNTRLDAPASKPGSSGALKIVLIVVAILVFAPCAMGVLAALLLPAIARSVQSSKIAQCRSNLVQLNTAMAQYRVQFGKDPAATGGAYWLTLRDTNPPLVDPVLLQCPLEGNPGAGTDYRGPAEDPALYGEGDPLGADMEGNHSRRGRSGGNVLRKSGDIMHVEPTDPLWAAAATKTVP